MHPGLELTSVMLCRSLVVENPVPKFDEVSAPDYTVMTWIHGVRVHGFNCVDTGTDDRGSELGQLGRQHCEEPRRGGMRRKQNMGSGQSFPPPPASNRIRKYVYICIYL